MILNSAQKSLLSVNDDFQFIFKRKRKRRASSNSIFPSTISQNRLVFNQKVFYRLNRTVEVFYWLNKTCAVNKMSHVGEKCLMLQKNVSCCFLHQIRSNLYKLSKSWIIQTWPGRLVTRNYIQSNPAPLALSDCQPCQYFFFFKWP